MSHKPTYEDELKAKVFEAELRKLERKVDDTGHNDITERKRLERELFHMHDLMHYVIWQANAAIAIHDRDMKYIYVSENYLKQYKVKEKDVIGKHHYDVFPDLPQKWRDVHQRVLAGAVEGNDEDSYVRADGSVDWTRWTCRPWYESDGSIGGLIVDTEVITERKRAEEALRKSEAKFVKLFQSSPIVTALSTKHDGSYIDINQAFLDTLGYQREEVIGKTSMSLGILQAEDRQRLIIAISENSYFENIEIVVRSKNGVLVPGLFSAEYITLGDEDVLLTTFVDITERKRAEELFREKEYLLSESQKIAHVGSWTMALDSMKTQLSDETYRIFGVTPVCFVPSPESFLGLIHRDDRPGMEKWIQDCIAGMNPSGMDFRIIWPNGSVRFLRGHGHRQCAPDGTPLHLIGSVQDITERKQAEDKLRHQENKLSSIFRVAPVGIGMVINRVFQEVNDTLCRMTGYSREELLGQNARMVYPTQKDYDYVGQEKYRQIGEKTTGTLETRFQRKDGTVIDIILSSTPLDPDNLAKGVTFIALDITERKRAEAEKAKLQDQLLQSQKIEAIGQLAGGVAHDFNNMLGVILGHTELALDSVKQSDPLNTHLAEIRKAAQRSSELTSQLLAFARKQTMTPKILNLNDTINGMLKMLRRLIGEDIDLNWLPDSTLWPVKADPSQIDQILANLCVNARDAIQGVGKITVETRNISLDESYCVDHKGFVPGDYVQLCVSDNGSGMDKETLDRLFEPFFTTKGPGKGTGLGLATVYGIVKQNNGYINVYSEPDQGTTFKIYLPRYAGQTELASTEKVREAEMRGQETILLVEDEPSLLELNTLILESQGYRVLAAGAPGEAIRLAEEHRGNIHLLMTDVVMPEMNGRDLAKNLLALNPQLKCLFTSGYTADVIALHGVLDEGLFFIQKPFSRKDLAAKVREVLDHK